MDYISIHDTHRLPYLNATITAKKIQPGDTTPVKFINCFNDEELGYEVYTNAAGYLCDITGTLYEKGVFVGEDACITATLRDGTSTSWNVRSDTDVTVNDGLLLGKEVPPEEQVEDETYAFKDGVWRLVLHSANTNKDRKLPLSDLADLPAFNEWKEVQQVPIDKLSISNKRVEIEEYTKTLILQWEGVNPSDHTPIYITVGRKVVNGRQRYAQHCLVYNQTNFRLTLINESGSTIGSVAPSGTMNIGLFFPDSPTSAEWLQDDMLLDWDNGADATTSGQSFVEVSGQPAFVNKFVVTVNDRTPNVLLVKAKNISLSSTPQPGEVGIKLSVTGGLTKAKKITLWFQNESTGSGATLPAIFYTTASEIPLCQLQSGTMCELLLPATGNNDFTESNNVLLLDNSNRPGDNSVIFTISQSGPRQFTVPKKCDLVSIVNNGSAGTVNLIFQDCSQMTRVNVTNNAAGALWIDCYGAGNKQLSYVATANIAINFTVQNEFQLINGAGQNRYSTVIKGDDGGGSNWDWFNMVGCSNIVKLNFHRLGQLWDNDPMRYGQLGSSVGDVTVRVPINSGETREFYFDIPEFVNYGTKDIGLSIGLLDVVAAKSDREYVQDKENPIVTVPAQLLKATVTRSGNDVTVVWEHFCDERSVW